MQHLIGVSQLTWEEIDKLFQQARYRLKQPTGHELSRKVVAILFFEPSTRTRFSFEVAIKKLGGETINFTTSGSSIEKGETLEDTLCMLQEMGVDALVVRHSQNGVMASLAEMLEVPVINAGEGTLEHPTQCLLDLFTIHQEFGQLASLRVAIIGDVLHSRVAGSHLRLLPRLGVQVLLAGPPEWMPDSPPPGVRRVSMEEALTCDVVMPLRVQRERMAESSLPDMAEYRQVYGLTSDRAEKLLPHAIIMHPGPFNRGVEIDGEVVKHPQSRIFRQVAHGVAIRQAVLEAILNKRSDAQCHRAIQMSM